MKGKVLVTGASGFIGRRLVTALRGRVSPPLHGPECASGGS